jgi:hypothetical protein
MADTPGDLGPAQRHGRTSPVGPAPFPADPRARLTTSVSEPLQQPKQALSACGDYQHDEQGKRRGAGSPTCTATRVSMHTSVLAQGPIDP